tara:strand:+ start:105614 stop:108205 length:2592 start_codon:yes stop_codon:yes gene_type:complete
MGEQDRFYACESLGFPEVTQYDYQTNLPVRGVNDRDFRWEEVAVRSVYLMQEATVSGSFELNSYIADFSITNPTGVNLITTYTGVNSGSYDGWTMTGDSTVFIGMSGIQVNSGDLGTVTESFYAHPIVGNDAIGLYCSGDAPYPGMLSNELATGDAGPVVLGNTHQLYLRSKLNYGTSGNIHPVVRGWSAGSIVAYYDPFSGMWSAVESTQSYPVSSTGYTTIKYQFPTTSFPAATPTSFDIHLYSDVSGSFLTVDDVHLDALMKKNAFLDYIVPTGYMVQVTPDLGWHDIVSMFDSDENTVNPHLKTLGPYQSDLGNLNDNLDNTVTVSFDLEDLDAATSDNFKKYLWRALPLSPNGQLGIGGLPARFDYVGNLTDSLFQVTDIIDEDTSTNKTILGSKSSSMRIVVDELDDFPGLTYPTPTTWKLVINISSPSRTLAIKAIDTSGAQSSVRSITLTNKLYEQNSSALWNVFDEHGLVADVERLEQESNHDYSLRIKDSYLFRSSPDFVGIINGSSRELNLTKVPDAITLTINKNQYNTSKAEDFDIEVTPYSFRLFNPMFTKTERLLIDPVYKTVELSSLPRELPYTVQSDISADIKLKDITLQLSEDSSRITYRAKIDCQKSTYVDVTYQYSEELLFKEHETLASIIDYINNIKDPSGQPILTARISSLLSGNEPALGLYLTSTILESRGPTIVGWSPIILKKMTDVGYKDYFLNEDNTLKETEYYEFVKELKNNTKVFWGAVEVDRDRWDSADSKSLSMESIPTLFDPPTSKILSIISGKDQRVDPTVAWGRDYVGFNSEYLLNVGLSSILFQPGVAHTTDLQPDLYLTTSFTNSTESLESNIGPTQNNNNFVIFSGQK